MSFHSRFSRYGHEHLLLPELGEDAAAELHTLQGLLGDLHLAVDNVQPALNLLQLL